MALALVAEGREVMGSARERSRPNPDIPPAWLAPSLSAPARTWLWALARFAVGLLGTVLALMLVYILMMQFGDMP